MVQFLAGVGTGLIISGIIVWAAESGMIEQGRAEIRQEAIDHGYMQYNPTTGEPEWVGKETGE